ncbi:MAG: phenylalanine--tRNA ligase subunit beta [Acidobacteriota bacterium]|nr:MAG: phenylalanine--tRNA ligase subunit beta [Acidobacteriota bacterium]
MRFSYNWLREYVEISATPPALGEALTMLGFPLDGLEADGGDALLDVDITTNRPDVMNHVGLAREIAAKYALSLKAPSPRSFKPKDNVSVTVEAPDLCPRYSARLVRGLRNAPAPAWMRERLERAGMRPINGVVDVTNYVLFELGQPLHAFDFSRLREGRVVVRRAREGEAMAMLDGQERKFSSSALVIADAKAPVALAGVMGGAESEVGAATTDVLLESAHFDPLSVCRTARTLGLKTEASLRFERGADFGITMHALDRTCELLLENFGGEVVGEADVVAKSLSAREVSLRCERLKAFLGSAPGLERRWVGELFGRLGFEVLEEKDDVMHLRVPTFRSDVEREEDLFEEVARHYGYDRIAPELPALAEPGAGVLREEKLERAARQAVVEAGYQEVVSYSMVDAKREELLGSDSRDLVSLANPLSEEIAVLRRSLYQGLLDSLARNLNRGARDVRLFEMGATFSLPKSSDDLADESPALAAVACGASAPRQWRREPEEIDFYDVRAVVERLFERLRLSPAVGFRRASHPLYHPHRCAEIFLSSAPEGSGEERVGECGELASRVTRAWDIEVPVYAFHVALARVWERAWPSVVFAPVSRLNPLRRDMSFLADAALPFARVDAMLKSTRWPDVRRIDVVDVYEGSSLPKGRRSLTLEVEFQPEARTLSEADVAGVMRRIAEALEKELGLELRGML